MKKLDLVDSTQFLNKRHVKAGSELTIGLVRILLRDFGNEQNELVIKNVFEWLGKKDYLSDDSKEMMDEFNEYLNKGK